MKGTKSPPNHQQLEVTTKHKRNESPRGSLTCNHGLRCMTYAFLPPTNPREAGTGNIVSSAAFVYLLFLPGCLCAHLHRHLVIEIFQGLSFFKVDCIEVVLSSSLLLCVSFFHHSIFFLSLVFTFHFSLSFSLFSLFSKRVL